MMFYILLSGRWRRCCKCFDQRKLFEMRDQLVKKRYMYMQCAKFCDCFLDSWSTVIPSQLLCKLFNFFKDSTAAPFFVKESLIATAFVFCAKGIKAESGEQHKGMQPRWNQKLPLGLRSSGKLPRHGRKPEHLVEFFLLNHGGEKNSQSQVLLGEICGLQGFEG